MKTKVIITNSQKKVKVTLKLKSLVKSACRATLKNEGVLKPAEVSVTFVDDEEIRLINAEHRDIDRATDVLSFPLGSDGVYDYNPENGNIMLGDVVLSLERAVSQAKEYGHSFEREAAYLTVHSMLHLLGYDHVNNEEEKNIMREREEQVMALLGLRR